MFDAFAAVVDLHERMCEQYPELRDVPTIGPVTFEEPKL